MNSGRDKLEQLRLKAQYPCGHDFCIHFDVGRCCLEVPKCERCRKEVATGTGVVTHPNDGYAGINLSRMLWLCEKCRASTEAVGWTPLDETNLGALRHEEGL